MVVATHLYKKLRRDDFAIFCNGLIVAITMKKNITKFICINAVIAGLYVLFTMPFGIIAVNSNLQFRPAEALTILPALCPYTVVGLTIGCAIANTISPFGAFDVVLGSAVTLIAGLLTSTKLFRRSYLAPIPPIVLNAFFLPLIWILGGQGGNVVYWVSVGSLFITQGVVIYALGTPLYYLTKKTLLPMMQLEDTAKPTDQNN